MGQKVVFTGGSGKAGRTTISELLRYGHQVLNLDVTSLDQPGVTTLRTDLTQPGQVFSALTGQFRLVAPFPATPPPPPDAVIHFAGIARNMLVPDDETFRINTLAAYNVIDAACKLGVKKIILASSGCIYGVTFASGDIDYDGFPIDEDLDVNPMDTYGISKLCIEKIARGFARRFGVDIYCLRIGTVVAPNEYRAPYFESYIREPEIHKDSLWSYTDARDLGQICHLALEKSGLGYQVFNAVNDSSTLVHPTTEFLKKHCPNTAFTREMGEFEAPQSNAKLKRVLGFKEEYNWRMYYPELKKEESVADDTTPAEPKESVITNGVAEEKKEGQEVDHATPAEPKDSVITNGVVEEQKEVTIDDLKSAVQETTLSPSENERLAEEKGIPVIATVVESVNPS